MMHENIAAKNNLLMDTSIGILFYYEVLSNSEIKKFMSKKDAEQVENWKRDNDVSDIYSNVKTNTDTTQKE